MRVLQYVKCFLLVSETFIYDQVLRLEKDKTIHSRVLTNSRKNHDLYPLARISKINPYRRRFWRYFDLLTRQSYRKRVFRFFTLFEPEIIHAHFGVGGVEMIKIIPDKYLRIPMLVSLHGSDVSHLPHTIPEYKMALTDLFIQSNCYFTVNSEYLKEVVLELGAIESRVFLLYNSINRKFLTVNRVIRNDIKKIRVLCVARLEPIKGHIYLIKAFTEFLKVCDVQSELTLVGDGSLHEELVELVDQLNMRSHIKLVGSLPHRDLLKIFTDHDIYVQPSITIRESNQQEAFGVSVVEAMSIGLPVIVTKTGGLPKTILYESSHSIVVNESSSSSILQGLVDVVNNGSLKCINTELRNRVREVYSEDSAHRRLKEIYKIIKNNV